MSLIGNAIFQEQLAIENKAKKGDDYDYSKLSNSLLISESSNKSDTSKISDRGAKELDDYLSKRLAMVEQANPKKDKPKTPEKEPSQPAKPSAPKEKVVLYDDTEYEYILESEEDEDEDEESEDQT